MPRRHQFSSSRAIFKNRPQKVNWQGNAGTLARFRPARRLERRYDAHQGAPSQMHESFTWRAAKNRHCGPMTQQTETSNETQAKAGAMIVPVTLFEQNCTILWCEATKKAVVIDPGGDVPKIQAA